jgi:hypothetical protein
MRKLTELWVSVDNKGAYDSEGKLLFDDLQGKWVFWPTTSSDGVTYAAGLEDTLREMAVDYGADVYAFNATRGNAVIITPMAELAGLGTELDLVGYTVVTI